MVYETDGSIWSKKGATLSENNARKEYGLTHEEIKEAAEAGKIRWQMAYAHGNPYNKLVRCDVEAVVREKHDRRFLEVKKLETELQQIDKKLRSITRQKRELEKRRVEIQAALQP